MIYGEVAHYDSGTLPCGIQYFILSWIDFNGRARYKVEFEPRQKNQKESSFYSIEAAYQYIRKYNETGTSK